MATAPDSRTKTAKAESTSPYSAWTGASRTEPVAQTMRTRWPVTHGIVSLSIVFDNDDWIAWPDPEKTGLAAMDSMIRGIVREGMLSDRG